MVTREQVLELVDFKGDKHPVISLYLSLSPERLKNRGFLVEAKNLLRVIENNPVLEGEHKRILDFLQTKFDPSSRSIVIFTSPKDNFFQIYNIPIPVKNACIVSREPYIKQLIWLLEQYEKYCLVLVDTKKAKIFSIHMGKLVEHTSILDEVPGWHKQGGWSQARFQRHIEQHIYEHMKKVADTALYFFKREQLDRLIIGGPHEIVTHFKNILHIYLIRRFVGFLVVDIEASTQEVEKKVLSLIKKIEVEDDYKLMKRVLDNMGKMAVAGVEDVIGMLNQGRIQVLLVNPELKMKGWLCSKCHMIKTVQKPCEICGRDLEKSGDIIENIIEQNFELSGEVHFLANNKKLKELGSIAAILRW